MAALRELFREYWAHRPMDLAAALSYYTLLSLAPLALMAVAVASVIFERAAVEGKIVSEIRDLIGDSGAEVVHTILRNANNPQQDAVSALVGLALSRSTADGRFW
jgi:membrane protein